MTFLSAKSEQVTYLSIYDGSFENAASGTRSPNTIIQLFISSVQFCNFVICQCQTLEEFLLNVLLDRPFCPAYCCCCLLTLSPDTHTHTYAYTRLCNGHSIFLSFQTQEFHLNLTPPIAPILPVRCPLSAFSVRHLETSCHLGDAAVGDVPEGLSPIRHTHTHHRLDMDTWTWPRARTASHN